MPHHFPPSAITGGCSQLSFMCHIIYLSVPLQMEVIKSAILYVPHHLPVSAITVGGSQLSFMCNIIYLSVSLQLEVVSYPLCATPLTCQCHYRWRYSATLYVPHHSPVSAITDIGIHLPFMCHIMYMSMPLHREVVSYPLCATSFTYQFHYTWSYSAILYVSHH